MPLVGATLGGNVGRSMDATDRLRAAQALETLPTGGSRTKPVGTVCFAWALPSDTGPTLGAETAWVKVQTCHFEGDRAAVRQATHAHAIERLLELWHQR